MVLFFVGNVLHFAVATWWLGRNAKVWLLLREPVILAGIAGVLVSMSGIAMWPPFLSAIKIIADVSTGLMSFSLAGAGSTPGVEARASVPGHTIGDLFTPLMVMPRAGWPLLRVLLGRGSG